MSRLYYLNQLAAPVLRGDNLNEVLGTISHRDFSASTLKGWSQKGRLWASIAEDDHFQFSRYKGFLRFATDNQFAPSSKR